ncbi:MAG: ATP-binding cassette domain-containing protein [Candidatus Latescibacterota bacterium]|jgi:ABC-2 type transport system ATP-binding protein
MNTVELDDLTKTFGSHLAVDGLSLRVPPGSIYGFIGPNGSGKTTTLRIIMNILYPDRGSVRVFGAPVDRAAVARIGYLPEERGLYRKMKIRDLLRFFGEIKCGHRVDDDVDHWLERLELRGWAERKVESLSKGMSQKVQFIAAVVARPELVLLDEPFSGLDPVNAEAVRAAVLELRAQGATVLFSTHDMHLAEQLCDFVFMIHRGRKVLDGTLAQIRERFGRDTVRVRCDGGAAALRDLPGVESVTDLGQVQEGRLSPGTDLQTLLAGLAHRTVVWSFEVAHPSLHDIFVRIAGPQDQEVGR